MSRCKNCACSTVNSDYIWFVPIYSNSDVCGPASRSKLPENNRLKSFTIDPEKLGIRKFSMNKIKGKDAKFNAKEIRNLFKNKNANPFFKDVVLLNTAACLVIANKAKNLKSGLAIANKNLADGSALIKLNKLISISNE